MKNRFYINSILFIICICLFLTACGKNTGPDAPVPAEPSAAVQSEAPKITPSPSPTVVPTPVPTLRPLAEISLAEECIDNSFFEIPSEKGTLETRDYITYDYTGSGEPVTKQLAVYTPYGYDSEKQYNVLFLMHTMSGSERFWFSEHEYRTSDGSVRGLYIPYLIDNMIEKGLCRELIVVSLCGYIDDDARNLRDSSHDFSQFTKEFRNDILPFMRANYSISEGRDHVAFMGASFGAFLNYRCILGPNYDLVSNFALTGGGMIEPAWLVSQWDSINASDLKADMIYIAEGDSDDRGPVELGYMYLAANTSSYNSDNLKFTLYKNTAHEFREWDNTLYNCLQLFFREGE